MKNLDRFLNVMRYGAFDHPPLLAEGPWPDTLARWRAEGLADGVSWQQYFGIQSFGITHHGFNHGLCPPFEQQVLEETAEHVISINAGGVRVRNVRHATSMPEWLEFPVKDRKSFERVLERFELRLEQRFPANFDDLVRQWNAPDFDALLLPPAGNYFSTLSNLAGVETVSYLFFDCPDLIHRLHETICQACCWFNERMLPATKNVFCIGTGEDLAFKNGPFFSPAMFEEFYLPYYRRVVDGARRHGIQLFFLDTDGNFDALAPQMLDLGMNIFSPMEVAAGMDPVALRAKYGRSFRMMGGVDKRIVAAGKEAIRKELERLFPLVCEGGYIPSIDHSVSSDISWDNFRYYLETLMALHQRCANRA
ncbi:MAG: uroporphyrinogen decarboxylase family protein [bacterium]